MYGSAQRRDRRDFGRSCSSEGVAPWFGGLFTHKGEPKKKSPKKTRRPKSRGWFRFPRSSQEFGLVGIGFGLAILMYVGTKHTIEKTNKPFFAFPDFL